MFRKRLTGLVVLVLAAAGLAAAPVAQADTASPGGLHDFRGHFAVFTRAMDDPDIRPGTLDITTQLGPIVTGRANMTGRTVAVTGTITRDGAVTLTGLDGLGVLTIRARIPDLTTGDLVPCILEGRFRVSSLGGVRAEGDLVAVHQVPATGAPSIGGDWSGVMIQDVGERPTPVDLTVTQSPTGALAGRMSLVLTDPPDSDRRVQLTVVGHVAWDNPDLRPPAYLLIGGGDGVLATAILDPGSIIDPGSRGPIRLLLADGTVQQATIQLEPVRR